MIGRTNAEIPGSDNITYVQLNYAVSGIRITASNTATNKTALTDATGKAAFKHLPLGYTWSFTSEGGATASEYLGDLTENVSVAITRTTVKTINTASTITATNQAGTVTKTATLSSGEAVFYDLPNGETWTFDDGTDSKTATIGADTVVTLGAQVISIYGRNYGSSSHNCNIYHCTDTYIQSGVTYCTQREQIGQVTIIASGQYSLLGTIEVEAGELYALSYGANDYMYIHKNDSSGQQIQHTTVYAPNPQNADYMIGFDATADLTSIYVDYSED